MKSPIGKQYEVLVPFYSLMGDQFKREQTFGVLSTKDSIWFTTDMLKFVVGDDMVASLEYMEASAHDLHNFCRELIATKDAATTIIPDSNTPLPENSDECWTNFYFSGDSPATIPLDDLTDFLDPAPIVAKKCTCGCASIGISKHSDYCDAYVKA